MICIDCKLGQLEGRKADIPAEVKGEKLLVRMDALVCPNCGYATIDGSRMSEYMRLSADVYRRKHAMLTSSEIRDRRKAMRMNQGQFASYLGTGLASIKRWELGQIQDQAMDRLIRLMTDVESAKNNYINVAALTAPVEATIFGLMPGVGFIVGATPTAEWEPSPPNQYLIPVSEWERELAAA